MKKIQLKRNLIFLLGILFISWNNVSAQCPVTAYASPMSVQCGDPISLTAVSAGCSPLNNNFNSGTIGNDWQATTGAVVTDGAAFPNATYGCVGPPPEGTHCLWMGATVAAPRQVKTKNYNLTQCQVGSTSSIGATICFTMKFATQAGPDPCEGIDLPEEGVGLEYSIDNGANWVNIAYYAPNGGYDPIRTAWTQYCVNVPAAAITTSTQFRWIQQNSSGAGFDTWGLDDMVISLITPGYTYDWAHDSQGPQATSDTPDIIGDHDTTLTVTYTNGVETCSSSVTVLVANVTGSITANPISVCAGGTSQLAVTASLIPPLPPACGISLTGCQGTSVRLPFGAGTVNETTYTPLGKTNIGAGNFCFDLNGTMTSTFDASGRMQMIINQSEFPGYYAGGQIYNLSLFPIDSAGTYSNVTVKIGCTTSSQFTSNTDFKSGLVTVFNPKPVNFDANQEVILDFDNHYDWPGGTNLVIEVCWAGGSPRAGNLFKTATTNFSTIYAHTCTSNECGTVKEATRYQLRPSMKLGLCYRPIPVINYSWNPSVSLNNSNIPNPIATLNNTTTYTVTMSDPLKTMCDITQNVTVTVVQPTVTISPSPANICASGGSVTLTANAIPSVPGGTITSYAWSPAAGLNNTNTSTVTASPAATTTYTLVVTDNTGCTSTTTVTVSVGQPAGPTAVNGSRCGTGTVSLGVTGCGGTVKWYDAATGGTLLFTGNPFTTPSISSNTTYYASCTVTGCESSRTAVTASINSSPNANFNYTPTTYCKTGANATPTVTGTSGTFTASPAGLTINSTTGVVTVSSSNAGTYTVTNTIAATAGCPATTATAPITITAPPVASFQYNGSPYCPNASNPYPTFINGGQGGTFSSTAGLVFVSTTTGEISLSGSTPGTYTITNTIPAANGCAAVTATFPVTINPPKNATFNYAASTFCKSGPNPTPTITGTPGGAFSASPNTLVFTSASSGTINLAATPVGTYTITYITPGPCSATSSVVINVTNAPVATFNYGNAPYCQSAANPNPVFTGGGVAGTFTSSPAGLVFVSNTTGQVNLASSTPGTYTVTNTVTATGCSPATATANITINAPQTANFTYSQASYCQSDSDPTAMITAGSVAGTFSSSPAGMTINSTNGLIDVSASAAGTYTITNTLAATGGCPSVTFTQNVTINPSQDPTFNYSASTYCLNGTDPTPTITGNTGGTFTGSAGLVFSNATNGTVDLTNTPVGTYTVTYSLAAPCPATSNVSITVTSSPDASFSYAGPYCLNEPTNPSPTFGPGASGGTFSSTAGLVFVSTTSGTVNLSASTAGTYTVTNSIPASGSCPAVSSTASIVLNTTDNATFSYASTSYCSNSPNPTPTITGTPGGAFSSTAGLVFISNATGQVNLTASTAGTYTITYTTTGACPATSSVTMSISNPSVPDFEYTNSPFCQNATNPAATFINGGVAGTFSEATGNLIFNNFSTGEVNLEASIPGTYTVRNTLNANGACPSVFFESTITITALPDATFAYPNSPYCITGANPTVVLGSGAANGTYSTLDPNISILNPSTGEIDLTNSVAGMYTITNTIPSGGGCPAVTYNTPIELTSPANGQFSYPASPYCQSGGNATASIAPGSTAGTFSSSAGLALDAVTGEVNVAASQLGTYRVYNSVDPLNGCPVKLDSADITISNVTDASFNFAPQYCNNLANPFPTFPAGASAGAFSSTAGLVFVSTSTGQINLSASTPGTYTITNDIPANGGCPASNATDVVTIDPSENAGFNYSQSTYCSLGTDPAANITGTPGGIFSYTPNGLSINTSTGLIDLDQSIMTTYNLTYTTQGTCFDDSTITITITDAPNADFQYTPASYCEADADPTPVFINGGSAGTFTAAPSGLVFINANTGLVDLSASTPNNYNVTNTIVAANGCPGATYTSVISIAANPNAEFSYSKAAYCQNEANPTTSHVTGTNGIYTATPAGLQFVSNTTGEVNLATSASGVYSIRNIVFGTGSCPNDTVYQSLEIYAMPTVNPSSNSPVCEGSALNLFVTTAPMNPTTTFAWSGPNSFTSMNQNPIIDSAIVAASGNYTIQITTNGCTSFAILNNVVVNPNGPTNFGPSGPLCANDNPINLSTSNPGGTWSGNGITNTNQGTFDPIVSGIGTHTVTYYNGTSCILDSVDVFVKALPVPDFTVSPDMGCLPVTSQFTSSGGQAGDSYFWDFGNGSTSTQGPNVSQTFTTSGCKDVDLTITRNGCSASITKTDAICAFPQAVASFTTSPDKADVSFAYFSMNNNSTNASSYLWDFGDGQTSSATSPNYTYVAGPGNYTITLIANNNANCPDTAYRTITISQDLLYYIPNAFTPDNDKFNQTFMPVFTAGYDPNDYEFTVYNRWGEEIFISNDTRIGWDGTYKGQLAPQGVYIWKVNFKSMGTDGRIIDTGTINLLR